VSRINFTDRKSSLLHLGETATVEGLAHAHKFQAGSKIRIVLTNFDTTPEDRDFLSTNPHVLPVMDNNISLVFLKNSYIELPLRTGGDNLFNNPTVELRTPTLHQNFPNPFNPTTNIRFELPAEFKGNVSLKIYDM